MTEEYQKKPKLKTKLLPYQQRVVDRILKSPGLVVAHGLGSGKTLSSIAAGIGLSPEKMEVVVPAGLMENYKKEVKKHTRGEFPIDFLSLQGVSRDSTIPDSDFLVVDEAHRIRNMGKTYAALSKAIAKKRMLLTGSPIYNKPEDIAPLINLVAGKNILPTGTDFEKEFVKKPPTGLWALMPWVSNSPSITHKNELDKILNKWVDYHKDERGVDYPDVDYKNIEVPMNDRQTKLHDLAWGRMPFLTRLKVWKGLPPGKQDLSDLNKFQSQVRQISNSEVPFVASGVTDVVPKLKKAFSNFKSKLEHNPNHKALIYSNYLNTLKDYTKMLDKNSIPYAVYTGEQTERERKVIREAYNTGKIKALLVSSAGGEGLDLKGTREVQILEPHWNDEKIKQVIGRAIRHGSHASLPEKERQVKVERYTTYPTGIFGRRKKGIEDYLTEMSNQKENLNQQVLDLFK
jgi:SNF2 family DNA or RNA helicase